MLDRRNFIMLAGAALAAPAVRAETPRPVNTLGSPDRLAIRGYDPVAYFRNGGPRLGKPEFSVSHGGSVWRFASAEHKALPFAESCAANQISSPRLIRSTPCRMSSRLNVSFNSPITTTGWAIVPKVDNIAVPDFSLHGVAQGLEEALDG